MPKALEGIRVVDLTIWFQGPVAAQHLADFGAEVIHVERPLRGDQGRGVRSIKALPVGDWNQYFLVINRNKKSLAVDLKQPAGQEILYRLVEKSDVFLSNVGHENLAKWQLGYEKLREVNPRLVYATTTGYGHYGGISKPSFDMTVQALTGMPSTSTVHVPHTCTSQERLAPVRPSRSRSTSSSSSCGSIRSGVGAPLMTGSMCIVTAPGRTGPGLVRPFAPRQPSTHP